MNKGKIEELLKNAKPVAEPTIKAKITKSCLNCADYIVCYGLDEPEDPTKGENCPDWQLDFLDYQEMIGAERENK